MNRHPGKLSRSGSAGRDLSTSSIAEYPTMSLNIMEESWRWSVMGFEFRIYY
jgi:hypothetical protein